MSFAERSTVRDSTNWSRVWFGVAIGGFAAYQQFKLPPILPDFLARYPHSPITAAGFMSVYALVGFMVSAPIGRRLDRHLGRAVIVLFALTVIGVTVALLAPQSAAAMLASRAIEGLAFAFGAIAGPTISAAAASPRDLPLVTGLLAGWIPIGQICAALLALVVPDWRWLWVLGIAAVAPLALWGRALWRRPPPEHAAAQRAASRQPSRAERRELLLAAAIFMLWSAQYFAFMTWLTQYLTTAMALGRAASVLAYLLPVVVLLGCNVLTGWALRHGLPLIGALAVALLSQAAIWFAQPWLSGSVGVAGLVLYGIGAGVTPTCLFQTPHAIARGPAGAAFFGIIMTGRNIGVFIGPILLAWLIGRESFALGLGWTAAARVIAGLTLIAAAITLALGRQMRRG
jgi:predicted MFS family arabinose efflux permease